MYENFNFKITDFIIKKARAEFLSQQNVNFQEIDDDLKKYGNISRIRVGWYMISFNIQLLFYKTPTKFYYLGARDYKSL